MRTLYVIECDLPSAAVAAEPIKAINPPAVPYCTGAVRVVVEPHAGALLAWLDESAEDELA